MDTKQTKTEVEQPKVIDFSSVELSADDILGVDDKTLAKVVVPEWKGSIHFRPMSALRSIEFQRMLLNPSKREGIFVSMFQECACDSMGRQLFTPTHLQALREKNVAVFLRLQNFLMQLNGMVQVQKNWDTVHSIMTEAGVSAEVIALAKAKWEESDAVQVVKNA